MKNFQESIDNLVTKILNEEIDAKVKQIMENKGEWEEELHGGQSKIDVAEPKGKITAADFKKLRDAKSHKKEVEEYFVHDEEEEEAEELSQNEPTYVGMGLKDNKVMAKLKNALRSFNDEDEEELDIETDWSQLEEDMDFEDEESIDTEYENDDNDWEEIDLDDETDWSQLEENKMFGSFDDEHGWFDQHDREHSGDFDFDYDEEEFQDFPSLMSKHGEKQRWFGPNDGEKFFNKYQEKFGGKPFRVRIPKSLEEDEATEGNAFTGALAKAKSSGKDSFEVDGKEYNVNESEDKWIQKTDMKKGALHKKLGVPEGQKIPKSKLNSIKKDLMAKAKGDKKLSASDSKLLKQVNMALTLGGLKESKNTLKLTENELIDMIEKIGAITNKVESATNLNTEIQQSFQHLKKAEKPKNICYLIWQNPYMTIGGDTFINDILQRCGLKNVFSDTKRYPIITIQEMKDANPEIILLSSEPYPFKAKHIDALQLQFPNTNIKLVDGEMFSWYGSRLLKSVNYFNSLLKEISLETC